MCSTFIAFVLLLITTLLILYVKIYEIDLKADVISCNSEEVITKDQALEDFYKPEEQ